MRAPRHRPIVWPVFVARRDDRPAERHRCSDVASDPLSGPALPAAGAESCPACPTCGHSLGSDELERSEDEPR